MARRGIILSRRPGGTGGGGGAPSGPAGGDLTGTYPNPDIAAGAVTATEAPFAVPNALYDANTVLAANADNTPLALTMGASTILARLAAGNIKAASVAEIRTLLGLDPLAYVEGTNNVTITSASEATPDDVISAGSVTFDGTLVKIEFYCAQVECASSAGAALTGNLWIDSTDLGRVLVRGQGNGRVIDNESYIVRYHTPSAGAHTYKIRGWRATANGAFVAGTGGGGAGEEAVPMFIRISKA